MTWTVYLNGEQISTSPFYNDALENAKWALTNKDVPPFSACLIVADQTALVATAVVDDANGVRVLELPYTRPGQE